MKKIKFSNDYIKLPENWQGTQALLLAVYPEKVEKIKNAYTSFFNFDTKIRGEEKGRQYPIYFDDALILVFMHYNTGRLFPTIRRDYPDKRRYYMASIGDTFMMVDSSEEVR